MKTITKVVLIAATMASASSCATLINGSKQQISFKSEPSGAKVLANGTEVCPATPCFNVNVKRGGGVMNYTFRKDGFADGQMTDNAMISGWYWLDIFTGAGWIVDIVSGGAFYWQRSDIDYKFANASVYANDPTIRAGEATNMVSRDKPGGTSLERTIIRWNFESDPRGARIFWRVISSIPDQVKNTNETYLTTTPYEETRSFNILGLTYENSRDVTIEIKVRRKGYYDQVKRYNVRQAIDQQEISGFFDMVREDE
jgi:hypothetical protein